VPDLERPRTALVVDGESAAQRTLCHDVAKCGYEPRAVRTAEELGRAFHDVLPDVIAAEYRVAGKRVDDLLDAVPTALWSRLVIVTSYGSIASAVRAVRLGVAGYLIKPARGDQVLRAAGVVLPGTAPEVAALRAAEGNSEENAQPHLSLDRAIWEFLTQAVEEAGSLSGAARLLGLHARSLRRMLAKYPPPR
jgi:ActR/RegA family two-component response regulator